MITIAIIGAGNVTSRMKEIILSHSSNRSDIQVVTATTTGNEVFIGPTVTTIPNDYMDRTVIDVNEELRKMTMPEYDYAELERAALAASYATSLFYEDIDDYDFEEVVYPPYQTPKKVLLVKTYASTQLTSHSRGARNTLSCNKIIHVKRKRNRRNL